MKKQIKLDDAVGKTLTGHSWGFGSQCALFFGDEMCVLDITRGHESCNDGIEESDFDLEDFGYSQAVEAEIMTQKEIDERKQRHRGLARKPLKMKDFFELDGMTGRYAREKKMKEMGMT